MDDSERERYLRILNDAHYAWNMEAYGPAAQELYDPIADPYLQRAKARDEEYRVLDAGKSALKGWCGWRAAEEVPVAALAMAKKIMRRNR